MSQAEGFDFEAGIGQMREAMARIESVMQEEAARFAEESRAYEEPLERIAQERRSGSAGRDWRVLQQRMDLGETSMEAILSGADESEEAAAVRAQLEAMGPMLRAEYARTLDGEDQRPGVAEVQRAQAELAAAIDEIQALIREL